LNKVIKMIKQINIPFKGDLNELQVGDRIEISGFILTARDAVMAKLEKMIFEDDLRTFGVNLKGSAIMHTAFSPAGYGPTSSNKEEIEGMMGLLSQKGVKFHLGKGAIKQTTVRDLNEFNSVFVVIPPISALLADRLIAKRVVAFPEEGVEAMHELIVERLPGIVAVAHGKSIFDK